jgi:hypothetical protein
VKLSTREAVRLIGVTTFAVMVAFSAWLLGRPAHGRAADCNTARVMWSYYESQMTSARAATQDSNADNSQTEAAYQTMINGLQAFANRITTPEIRGKANEIVSINRDMFGRWKSWAAASQSEPSASATLTASDRQFGREFARDGKKLETAHATLETTCRS